jgi:aspartyl-tRNA(Asn)/glutamyl-tRNA(Gln) amidotransferase subunit C
MTGKKDIDTKTVERIAGIARLNLTDSETKKFQKDLNNILDAFKILDKAIDSKSVEPSFQPLDVKDVMREDDVEKCLGNEKALENTRHKEKGYFKGPRII